MKYFEKQIGTRFYKAGALPARKALGLKLKLGNILGPGLSGLKIPENKTPGDSLQVEGLNSNGMAAIATVASALGSLMATLDEKPFFYIVDMMLENVEVRVGDKYMTVLSQFDSIYMAELDEMYKVLGEVFVLNFPFLGKGLAEKLKGIISKVKTTTPSPLQSESESTSPTA